MLIPQALHAYRSPLNPYSGVWPEPVAYSNEALAEVLAGGLEMTEELARQYGSGSWPLLRQYQISLKKFLYHVGFRPDSTNAFHNALALRPDELPVPVLDTEQLLKVARMCRLRAHTDLENR